MINILCNTIIKIYIISLNYHERHYENYLPFYRPWFVIIIPVLIYFLSLRIYQYCCLICAKSEYANYNKSDDTKKKKKNNGMSILSSVEGV